MFKRKIRAFSLMEMLFVLIIISAIIVSSILYVTRKKQEDSARLLGIHMYQYGVALADYLRQNPENLKEADISRVSYQWLQQVVNPESCTQAGTNCDTFLGPDFKLEVPYIKFSPLSGNDIMQTNFHYDADSDQLVLKDIILGAVLIANQGEGSTDSYKPDPSLAGRAIKIANSYSSEYGPAKIRYGLENVANPYTNIIGLTMEAIGIQDQYLLVSGQNKMYGPVRFETSSPADERRVDNVHQISFGENTPPQVPSDSPEISGVDKIKFKSTAHRYSIGWRELTPVGKLEALPTCTVQGNGKGYLYNTESNNSSVSPGKVTYQKNPIYGAEDAYYTLSLTPRSGSICFITQFKGTDPNCRIRNYQNNYYLEVWKGDSNSNKSCSAECLVWDPSISLSGYCTRGPDGQL